jgi:hypothetical protein
MFGVDTKTKLKLILWWRRNKKFILSFTTLVILILIGIVAYSRYGKRTIVISKTKNTDKASTAIVNELSKAIAGGEYDAAIELLLQKRNEYPDDMALKNLYSQLMDSLRIDFKFNYLPGRRQQIATRGPLDEIVLTRKDPYYLIVHSSERCYLYLFQLKSSGEWVKLFPNSKYVPTSNPVPGGPIRIPDGSDWFYLDDIPGTETLYLLASKWRQEGLENLFTQLESEENKKKKEEIMGKILSGLEREEQATGHIPGLVFAKHQFRHEKSL